MDFRAAVFQSIADVRRARDAIAVLPDVDAGRIGIQGTSLGGFVTALAASLDQGFSAVFVMLAGGDLADVIRNGKQDTAKLRRALAKAGYTDDKLDQVLRAIEPTRIAHRLDPRRTWIYSGELDRVVPIRNAEALAKAAKLDERAPRQGRCRPLLGHHLLPPHRQGSGRALEIGARMNPPLFRVRPDYSSCATAVSAVSKLVGLGKLHTAETAVAHEGKESMNNPD